MTREEAIYRLKALLTMCDFRDAFGDRVDDKLYEDAVAMAIEALQEQATLDDVSNAYENGYQQGKFEATQKTGKWEMTEVRQYDLAYGGRIYVPEYRCSCCGHWYESYIRGDEPKMPDEADYPKYCEQCGARMECEEDG